MFYQNHNYIAYYKYNPIKEICQKQEKLIENYKMIIKGEVETNNILSSTGYDSHLECLENNNKKDEPEELIQTDDINLEKQQETKNDTESIINNQKEIINNYKQQIQDYQKQLHDLCYIYNNNLSVVQYQIQQINNTYAELGRLQQTSYMLQNEIKEYEEKMNYHKKMTNAFNTLLENPEYFYQLMIAAMTTSDINQITT